ncbi:alanine:cation symporter family protein [bacterium]|jgi:alanine or glycine:cation symporter, AGCS family|nr:alanine:cation symporter family protein [bacterium]MDA9775998.1 alanine:cation symporter family protein [Flavobacteriales bacterium]MDB9702401.1 alanine:cation symporter family protein [Flavobacteriales bacterium]|tara:strand:+ start:5002 stop:6681 length:1680 start_codon:yes stop_codon:yes gene_type:complete
MLNKFLSILFVVFPLIFLAQDQPALVENTQEVVNEISTTVAAAAETAKDLGLDEKIDKAFGNATGWFVETIFYAIPFSDTVKIPWVLIVLILGALYFTLYFKFINFRGFFTSIGIVRGKYDDLEDGGHVESSDVFPDSHEDILGDNPETIRVEGEHDGEVSHFQALTAALSATVGLGNIAGVAVALSLGGPGATFWMIVAGFLGMSSKFVECTLGVKYREIGEDGTVYGGPMYYLKKGIKGNFGKILAVVFAIMCIGGSFGGGNMFQVNQAFEMVQSVTGGETSFLAGYGALFGLVMAVLVGIVIIGGIKKIATVTEKIVPFMVAVYVLAVIAVLVMKIDLVPKAFGQIFTGAFTFAGVSGGFVGILIQGFQRAAFSNEAGIGSASIAHAAVKTKHPASEGLVALLEPFIDTVVVCTMTALMLIVSNMDGEVMEYGVKVTKGVEATSKAFEMSISWFPWVLTIAVVLFAFSSMISWSYYGFQAWTFLFGKSKMVGNAYKVIFCLFVIIGGAISLGSVIDFSDAMIFAMLVPNMIGLFFLAPKVKEELKKYMEKIKAFKA